MLYFLVALAFCLGAGLVLGSYFGVTKMPGMLLQRKLEARLEEVAMGSEPEPATGTDGAPKALLKAIEGGPLPAIDKFVSGTTRGSALGRWIEQSGVKTTISAILLLAVVHALVVGFLLMMLLKAMWGFILGAMLGFALPFAFLNMKRNRRLLAFEEAFPEALDLIARALKAGHAFITGLKMVADEMPEPIGPEFRKTFDEQNFGLPLKDALENLAHVVRERFKILRQVRVYTAHGRMTGYVLLALPAVLCIALAFINPDHMNLLFRERMGQMLLMVALTMQFIGYIWIRQVVKIEV